MRIDMTDQERELLMHLVQREIEDLGPEIRRTRTCTLRDELKEQRLTYRQILNHLKTGETSESHMIS